MISFFFFFSSSSSSSSDTLDEMSWISWDLVSIAYRRGAGNLACSFSPAEDLKSTGALRSSELPRYRIRSTILPLCNALLKVATLNNLPTSTIYWGPSTHRHKTSIFKSNYDTSQRRACLQTSPTLHRRIANPPPDSLRDRYLVPEPWSP